MLLLAVVEAAEISTENCHRKV